MAVQTECVLDVRWIGYDMADFHSSCDFPDDWGWVAVKRNNTDQHDQKGNDDEFTLIVIQAEEHGL